MAVEFNETSVFEALTKSIGIWNIRWKYDCFAHALDDITYPISGDVKLAHVMLDFDECFKEDFPFCIEISPFTILSNVISQWKPRCVKWDVRDFSEDERWALKWLFDTATEVVHVFFKLCPVLSFPRLEEPK